MRGSALTRLGNTALAACALLACVCATLAAHAKTITAADAKPGTVHPNQWSSVRRPIAVDAALEAHINALLAALTVEQKVGQLIQADIGSITPEELRHYPLGSILNGGDSSPGNNEFAPPSEWLAAADRFYDASIDPAHGGHPLPTLWGTDAVHGHNNIVGATIFPHNIGLGAARDADLIRHIGEVTAREVRATGLDWTFGPTLAVVRDDRWGRTYESYSEDPEIVRQYAAAMVLGLQGAPGTPQFLDSAHVIATPKHFLGDGGTGGRDQGDNRSSEAELRDIHGVGYPAAVAAGAQSVMASFSSWQGVKMHGHRGLLTDVLKGRMQFDALVVGDWNGHGKVPGCTNVSCPAAVNAGIDVLMAPDSWKQLYENTVAQAKSGEIPASRLDDAVRRILRVKLRVHLLDEGRPSSRPLAGHFELLGAPEHRAIARRAVRESLVLLKNRNHLLPLSPHMHVLVAGDGADSIAKQSGGWTITWQGTGVANKDFPNGESIYSGLRKAVQAAGGTAELSPSGELKSKPDVAIVVFGENPYAEFQGDVGSVEYSPGDKADLKLLRGLRASGVPVVALFLSGRPLWVNAEINASDAFVAAWLPGSEGGGVADVLFKAPDGSVRYDFHGKLSFSWPHSPQQAAVNRGQTGEPPLFPYGYGLRYADAGDVGKLSEDPGSATSSMVDTRVFFAAGRPGSGWHWAAGTDADAREIPGGVGGTSNSRLRLAATDRAAQEDARLIRWSGNGPARAGIAGKTAVDLQREADGQLSLAFDYKVDKAASADVNVQIECGPDCRGSVPITSELAAASAGEWRHLKIPLTCFAKAGADMSHITAPFFVATAGRLELGIANVRLESGTDAVRSCGQKNHS
jgi:beta-glucosidase